MDSSLSGFDPATMTYLAATQMGGQSGPSDGLDAFQDMMMPLEMPDHHSSYGFAGYDIPLRLLYTRVISGPMT